MLFKDGDIHHFFIPGFVYSLSKTMVIKIEKKLKATNFPKKIIYFNEQERRK